MSRVDAISRFKEFLTKLRSTTPDTVEHVAAEANVQDYRWILFSRGLTEAEIADLIRG